MCKLGRRVGRGGWGEVGQVQPSMLISTPIPAQVMAHASASAPAPDQKLLLSTFFWNFWQTHHSCEVQQQVLPLKMVVCQEHEQQRKVPMTWLINHNHNQLPLRSAHPPAGFRSSQGPNAPGILLDQSPVRSQSWRGPQQISLILWH